MLTVRDFIYLDVERLNSLYSQVFQGVIDTIVQTEVDEHETADTQEGGIRHFGSRLAERVAEASYKTESIVLYDHMYSLLEERLGEAIVRATDVSRQTYMDVLGQAFMVKVQGAAEIADFQRIRVVFDNFNKISEALNYVSTSSARQEVKTAMTALWDKVKAEKDRNRKAELKVQVTELERQLEQAGARLDETFLKHISYITDMFCSDRLEVTIHPKDGSEVIFRGITDKQWLRVSPDHLRVLYGGYPAPNWTMVGHLTYLPTDEAAGSDVNGEGKPRTMRDAYRVVLTGYQGVEKTFTDSKDFVEVVVWPLAIYREMTVRERGDPRETKSPS